jgi:hypothetical protein
MLNIDKKKESDSFLLRGDSDAKDSNLSQNMKSHNSFEAEKGFLESRPKSLKINTKLENKPESKDQTNFDPVDPSEDFFEEKGSESIIEKNEEESKFVDEESYSMVLNSKSQNQRHSMRSPGFLQGDENQKELSKIEDLEDSKTNNETSNEDESKLGKFLKIDSMISNSEIKDTKKIINELRTKNPNENSS